MSTKESRLKESCFARASVRRDFEAPDEAHAFRRRGTQGDARTKAPRLRLQNAYAVGLRSAVLKRRFGGAVPVPSPPSLARKLPCMRRDCAGRAVRGKYVRPTAGRLRALAHPQHGGRALPSPQNGRGSCPPPAFFCPDHGGISARNRLSHCGRPSESPRVTDRVTPRD